MNLLRIDPTKEKVVRDRETPPKKRMTGAPSLIVVAVPGGVAAMLGDLPKKAK